MVTGGAKPPALTLPIQQGTEALPAGETIDLAETILDALQTDELCPCNWEKAQEVLRPAA